MKKVIFITEYLNPPYDEGIKKTAYNLYIELKKKYELQVICRHGFKDSSVHIVNTNPLYFSKEVKSIIKDFNPDSIVYLPFQSSTFASYLRLKVLSFYAANSSLIFITLQPKPLKSWQRFLVRFIKPKFALTPSPILHQFWNTLGISNTLMPLLTDLSIFKPIANTNLKAALRKKYKLPKDAFIISHMGHLNEGRNLKTLIPLQESGNQVVIIGSSSTPSDALGQESLKEKLIEAGIIIIDQYIEHIEEIYQLSDIYIFPVVKENSSIGMPLSILEARGCAIPVITTDYGSIKLFLEDDSNGIFYEKPANFKECVLKIKKNPTKNYTKTSVSQLNKQFYDTIHKKINN